MGFIDGLFNAVKSKYEQLQRRIFKRKQQVFVNERFRTYAQSKK